MDTDNLKHIKWGSVSDKVSRCKIEIDRKKKRIIANEKKKRYLLRLKERDPAAFQAIRDRNNIQTKIKYDLNKKAEEEKMKQQRERNIVENIIDRLQIATAAHKIDYNFKSVINIAEIFGERDQSKEIFPGVTTNKVLLLLSSVYIIVIVISTITIMQWSNIQFHRPGFTKKELGNRRMFPGINPTGHEIIKHPDLNLVITLYLTNYYLFIILI